MDQFVHSIARDLIRQLNITSSELQTHKARHRLYGANILWDLYQLDIRERIKHESPATLGYIAWHGKGLHDSGPGTPMYKVQRNPNLWLDPGESGQWLITNMAIAVLVTQIADILESDRDM